MRDPPFSFSMRKSAFFAAASGGRRIVLLPIGDLGVANRRDHDLRKPVRRLGEIELGVVRRVEVR